MLNFYRKYWRTAFDIGLIVLTVFLTMWAFSFIYDIAKPIFYSFIIFLCIEPLAKRLNKWGIKKSIASAISVLLFVLIILGVIGAIILIAYAQGKELFELFPKYQYIISSELAGWTQQLQSIIDKTPLNINLAEELSKIPATLKDATAQLSEWAQLSGMYLFTQVTTFSSFIVNMAIGLILAYFLSIEIVDWKKFASKNTPNTFKTAFFFLRDNVLRGIWIYIKAQAILISITFVVILIALLAMGVNHAFIIALVAGIFDVLPLLGVSTIFVPWISYLFIVGEYQLAIMLTVLWLVVVLTRQLMEPKITGDSLGVSAFTMLAFMIISLSFFGMAGLILSPILLILIKALIDQGYLATWIRKPVGEYDEMVLTTQAHNDTPQPNMIEKAITALTKLNTTTKTQNKVSNEGESDTTEVEKKVAKKNEKEAND